MTSRDPQHDQSPPQTPEVRLASDDPAIQSLEASLDQLARHERGMVDAATLDRLAAASMRDARALAITHADLRITTTTTPSRAMSYRLAAMLALAVLGAFAAMLARHTGTQSTQPRLAQVPTKSATPTALPTDADWDLVDGALAVANAVNSSKSSTSELWNDAQSLQQQWSEGTWYDDGSGDSAS